MASIVTNSKIDDYVSRLFRERFVVLSNADEAEKSAMATMVARLRELRRSGGLIVAYDAALRRTVFVLQDSVELKKRSRQGFGGSLVMYLLYGR